MIGCVYMSKVSQEQKAIEVLVNLGYKVIAPKEKYKPITIKLAVKGLTTETVKAGVHTEALIEVGKHFELGKSVRFNYGYKGNARFVCVSNKEELLQVIREDNRRFYFVSVTLA